MTASLSFFPVGNGDMTLVETEGGYRILIDMNIRAAADDPDDDTPNVAKELRDRLTRDSQGRLYVDALLVSHPDEDHCRGIGAQPTRRTTSMPSKARAMATPMRSAAASVSRSPTWA